jgi:hypothetical protein
MNGKEPNNFQTESRIEKAIDLIANPPTPEAGFDVAVVITDLFLSSQELDESYGAEFRRSIAHILRSGRGVLIMAVEAPFKGEIFDLPSFGANAGPMHDGTHPFFVLAFGDVRKLEILRQRIADVAKPFGLGFETALFHDPEVAGMAGSNTAMAIASHPVVAPKGLLDPRIFDKVLELKADYEHIPEALRFPTLMLPRAQRSYWAPVTLTFNLPDALTNSSVPGAVRIHDAETFLFAGDDKDCVKRWQPFHAGAQDDAESMLVPSPPVSARNPTALRFTLFGDKQKAASFEALTNVRNPSGLFLFRMRLRWEPDTTRLTASTAAPPEWVARFGFTPAREADVLKAAFLALPPNRRKGPEGRPLATGGMFPALNLPEIMLALQRIQLDEIQMVAPIDLGVFAVAWRFD